MKTIILDNIRVPVEMGFGRGLDNSIISAAKKRLGTADFEYSGIFHKSIDARHKNKINYVVSAKFMIDDSFTLDGIKGCKINVIKEQEKLIPGNKKLENPPVITGSGPSGLFCAYLLALNGFEPIVLERGDNIDDRKKKVKKLWTNGELDTESNVQFGE
ncbi:MAG: NAD(P)-binding protein, partial [Clostridiales bacterium]|nr:NAD(P)-binding protein [Clostridiales bacterium]